MAFVPASFAAKCASYTHSSEALAISATSFLNHGKPYTLSVLRALLSCKKLAFENTHVHMPIANQIATLNVLKLVPI